MIAKPKTERPEDDAMRLPDHERGFGEYHISQFDRLSRKIARERAQAKPDEDKISKWLDERLDLEQSPRRNREAAAVSAGVAESVALAKGRGEEVQAVGDAVAVVTRDGLKRLRDRDRLTQEEHEVGMAYRRDREMREPLGSQLGAIGESGSAGDLQAYAARGMDRAKAGNMVAIIDRAVAARCTPAALQMLRWVAGDGHSISAFREGRAMGRNVEALRAALSVANTARKAEEERRRAEAKRAAKSQAP